MLLRNKSVTNQDLRTALLGSVFLAGSLIATSSVALADDSLTWNGITLYGTIDVGVAYQTHGAGLDNYFYPGLDYVISAASNKSQFTVAPNGLSQSKIGVKGSEALTDEFSGIFKLEAAFEPQSGQLADSSKSLVEQNGLTAAQQTTSSADGSRNGQAFSGAAYVGIDSKHFGTLTYGRQNSVLLDDINAYDPMGGSYAFSVIGFSGTTAGAGDTQDTRLDNSLKYALKFGPVHGSVIYQFQAPEDLSNGGYEFGLGAEEMGFSVDGVYSHINDAVKLASLSAAQYGTYPTPSTATCIANNKAAGCTGGYLPPNSLAATISDDSAYTINAKYTYGPAKIFGGYEHITYANPSHLLTAPFTNLGGYLISALTQNKYNINEKLDVYWGGLKYSILPDVDLTGAYYHYSNNDFNTSACTGSGITTSSSKCSGTLDAYSFMVDYRATKRFDIYGGFMYSTVAGGQASGFMYTNTIDPMIGARFSF